MKRAQPQVHNRIPAHVAIIMDGNGRWAKKRGLPRIAGHQAGSEAVRRIVRAAGSMGIKVLTLYAFSTENWKRPQSEINNLMFLLSRTLTEQTPELMRHNVRLSIIGNPEAFPRAVRKDLDDSVNRTKKNTGLILNLALNYGARQEIVHAVNRILKKKISKVDERCFARHLYTAKLPNPDILIRTSGEKRISNFLLWQCAYTELIFMSVFWPSFTRQHLKKAVHEFNKRQRRFGGL
ncbi:MAG: isoprenyl transferase [Elusimicrobia bacterium]|nr:isoprenyl transferase [Elusimicrobiota bacterium]